MPQEPRLYHTPNATYYEVEDRDQMAQAVVAAVQTAVAGFEKERDKRAKMKEIFVQLPVEQQQALYNTWSPNERKRYGIVPRVKTDVEKASDEVDLMRPALMRNTVKQAEAQTEREPEITKQLKAAVAKGELDLQEAQRISRIVNDPKSDDWDKAFAQGLRGQDAEMFVLNRRHPELAETMLQVNTKVGPEYEKRLTGEYFAKLTEQMGYVDPKYTLPTARALAKAAAQGDDSALDELTDDKGFPEAMQTLAYKNYKLNRDQLNQSRADRASSDRNVKAGLITRLMEQFPGDVGPTTATATAEALLAGKPIPGWAQEKYDRALKIKQEVTNVAVAENSMKVRERVMGIPEIRSGMETLNKLNEGDKQIPVLRKQLLQRMGDLYRIPESELQDPQSMWGRIFGGVMDAGKATGALVGDAAAGAMSGEFGDPTLDALLRDEAVPASIAPTGHANQPGFGSGRPDFTMRGTPNASSKVTPTPGRSEVLSRSAIRLIDEFRTATPERKLQIRDLLRRIKEDPDGASIMGQER